MDMLGRQKKCPICGNKNLEDKGTMPGQDAWQMCYNCGWSTPHDAETLELLKPLYENLKKKYGGTK